MNSSQYPSSQYPFDGCLEGYAVETNPDEAREQMRKPEQSPMEYEALIGSDTVGVLYMPSDYAKPRGGLLALWRRHLVANAGVRNRDYMEALFKRHFPRGTMIELKDRQVPADVMDSSKTIVLLFPDAIGIDFGRIERAIASRWRSKRVLALNGRRRLFRLDAKMRRRLALLRSLETFRIPEIAFLLVFLIATPVLVLFDMMTGRR
jgi:hypothetical protein